MLSRVAVLRTDVLEERIATFIRVTRIGELGTPLATSSKQALCEYTVTNEALEPCHPN
jgi:hypothetical protein